MSAPVSEVKSFFIESPLSRRFCVPGASRTRDRAATGNTSQRWGGLPDSREEFVKNTQAYMPHRDGRDVWPGKIALSLIVVVAAARQQDFAPTFAACERDAEFIRCRLRNATSFSQIERLSIYLRTWMA